MRRPIGQRIGAILGADDHDTKKIVNFLGYGTYEGEHIPDTAFGPLAEAARIYGFTNPKLKLDNGDIVWGCECWWGDERSIQENLEKYKGQGYEIITISIMEARTTSLAKEPL